MASKANYRVRAFNTRDEKKTGMALMSAFEGDPIFKALYSRKQFYESGAKFFELQTWIFSNSYKMTDVVEHEDGSIMASAIWEPNTSTFMGLLRMAYLVVFHIYSFGIARSIRAFRLFLSLEKKRHHHAPNAYHLAVLGTDGKYQGMGVGSKLIKAGLDRADRVGVPCYLESSNPKNVPFYKRHGFVPVEIVKPFEDAQDCIITLMVRQAKTYTDLTSK